jgi:hypothetical protein
MLVIVRNEKLQEKQHLDLKDNMEPEKIINVFLKVLSQDLVYKLLSEF